MDDESKVRFDEIDKRFSITEKRIDDLKWFIGGFATLSAILFGIITIILSWNFNNERASLREFQRDIKADLGKVDKPADIEQLGSNGLPLRGQEITTEVKKDDKGKYFINIRHFFKNNGDGGTGPLYMKVYTNEPLIQSNHSIDEKDFKYESYLTPKNIDPSELPGHFSSEQFMKFHLKDDIAPAPGKYKILFKTFYGKGKVDHSLFTIIIPKSQ